jgi:ribosomal-protein-alanine N-acetyltransferase
MASPFPFPILETERLILREWLDSDVEAMFNLFGREEVVRYTPIIPHTDPSLSLATIKRFRARFHEKQEGMVWAIIRKDTGEVIGETGINEWVKEHFRIVIGYSLNSHHWGNGFATEAVGRIIAYAFEDFPLFNVNRIEATTDPANVASIRVLENLGFTKEAYMRQSEIEKGKAVDSLMYAKLSNLFKVRVR